MKKNFVKKLGITVCSMALLLTPTSAFASQVNNNITDINTNTKIETYANGRYDGYTRGYILLRSTPSTTAPVVYTTLDKEFYSYADGAAAGWLYIRTATGHYGWARVSELCTL